MFLVSPYPVYRIRSFTITGGLRFELLFNESLTILSVSGLLSQILLRDFYGDIRFVVFYLFASYDTTIDFSYNPRVSGQLRYSKFIFKIVGIIYRHVLSLFAREELIKQVIFELANPELNQKLDTTKAEEYLKLLS